MGHDPSTDNLDDASFDGLPCETVSIDKAGHRWVFTCELGSESVLLRMLTDLATDENMPFDWFDAALVSHQLNRRLAAALCRGEPAADQPTTHSNPHPPHHQ